jgi:hypothetical protein
VVFFASLLQRLNVGVRSELPKNYRLFFRDLGKEIKAIRTAREMSQEDMIYHGFTVRHWQRMEAGEPFTVISLLRICEAFQIPIENLVARAGAHLRTKKTAKEV